MALPFLKPALKRKDQLVAVDLGSRMTKAVYLQAKDDGLSLLRYAILDAPIAEQGVSVEVLGEHLRAVVAQLNPKAKLMAVTASVSDVVIRTVEMPPVPLNEMRAIIKNNPKQHMAQELPDHTFDCYIMTQRSQAKPGDKDRAGGLTGKLKVLVAAARTRLVQDLQAAIKHAGLVPDSVVPMLITTINAFERAQPEVFTKEVVALVDIGFKNSTICLLQEGELILSRVVGIGGDKITEGLANALGISYVEAEGIKIGMPQEVVDSLEVVVRPLGRELRALMDFFEHQQDQQVRHVFVCGATARSDCILQILQSELMVECKRWDPVAGLKLELAPEQAAEIEHVAPQLAGAVGCALASI
ncbi:MAG: pilus assembly protein PilM [Verrucomicrobiae bacterium]|nr:pilus assembly protein PilM [Verrucomicrobiae bacterium]